MYIPIPPRLAISVCSIGLLVWCAVFLVTDKRLHQHILLGLMTYVMMVIIGVVGVSIQTEHFQKLHYTSLTESSSGNYLTLYVYKRLKPSTKYQKYLAKVINVNSHNASGRVLINIDSTYTGDIDEVIYTSAELIEIQKALNPHQFDYKNYMERQQVQHQMFLNTANAQKLRVQRTIYGYANAIRQRINASLREFKLPKENLSVINALLLGQRQDISRATYKSFTSSGTIHILAISGLHIGLLLVILVGLFKPLTYYKYGKEVVSILIIVLLWSYAVIVGLTPSVVRAVTMFSLFTIAIYSRRLTNTYNILVLSAFLLLLYHPRYIFEIGFQMSYLAVFAIIWIKPQFDTLWQPTSFISKKLWDVFTITLSAQFGILPLSLVYFHQFPGLFIVSNMVIIPLLGVLLTIGIITLVCAYFGWLPKLLVDLFDQCITWLLNFVEYISLQESFMFNHIPFNTWNLITFFVFTICFVMLWKQYSYKRLVLVLMSIVGIQLAYVYNLLQAQSEEFIVFNHYKSTTIGVKKDRHFKYATSHTSSQGFLNAYMVNENIKYVEEDSLKNVYQFKQNLIMIVDAQGVYNTSFNPGIIVLTASSKVNLERLISVVNPEIIVVDNNNYKSYVKRWKATCFKYDIPCHVVNEKGAYILQ
ncbi:MAG: ComEC/Rec2 family competence protein [Flavobacteriaceae bacterium]